MIYFPCSSAASDSVLDMLLLFFVMFYILPLTLYTYHILLYSINIKRSGDFKENLGPQ